MTNQEVNQLEISLIDMCNNFSGWFSINNSAIRFSSSNNDTLINIPRVEVSRTQRTQIAKFRSKKIVICHKGEMFWVTLTYLSSTDDYMVLDSSNKISIKKA